MKDIFNSTLIAALVIGFTLLFGNVTCKAQDCEAIEDLDDYAFCISMDAEEKITNRVVVEFIKKWGISKGVDAAIRGFVDEYGKINQITEDVFRRTYEHAQRVQREQERRRAREETHDHREWGGHLDNRPNPNVARGGMGA